jgi:hypothetical protein
VISLAFHKHEFYPPSTLELRVLPKPERQRPIIAEFRQRVTIKSQQAMQQRQQLSHPEIELQTWQEIEEDLLSIRDDSYL